jgi:hypothetical protein
MPGESAELEVTAIDLESLKACLRGWASLTAEQTQIPIRDIRAALAAIEQLERNHSARDWDLENDALSRRNDALRAEVERERLAWADTVNKNLALRKKLDKAKDALWKVFKSSQHVKVYEAIFWGIDDEAMLAVREALKEIAKDTEPE